MAEHLTETLAGFGLTWAPESRRSDGRRSLMHNGCTLGAFDVVEVWTLVGLLREVKAVGVLEGINTMAAAADGILAKATPTDSLRCEHGDDTCACLAKGDSRLGCLWSFPAKAGS